MITFFHVPEESQKSHVSVSGNERVFIRVKSVDDKLYRYHVVLTTKARQRSTTEKKREEKTELPNAKECAHVRFAT